MPYRITGLAHSAGGEMATSGETAKEALEIARQWAAQGGSTQMAELRPPAASQGITSAIITPGEQRT